MPRAPKAPKRVKIGEGPVQAPQEPEVVEKAGKAVDRYFPYSRLPVPGVPPEPIREGDGKAELSRTTPEFTVRLNAGEFMWIWRMIEARAVHHQNNIGMAAMLPIQQTVAYGSVRAFREAAGTIVPGFENSIPQPVGAVAKKAANGVPTPAAPGKKAMPVKAAVAKKTAPLKQAAAPAAPARKMFKRK